MKRLYLVKVKLRNNSDDVSSFIETVTIRAESPKEAAQTYVDADVNRLDMDLVFYVSELADPKHINVFTMDDLE